MNTVLAALACRHHAWKSWNSVAGAADGETNWKNQQDLYRGSVVDVQQRVDVCLGYPFSVGGTGRRFFSPLRRNFLTEQTVSSLFKKGVGSFESVFVFSLTKNVVKSQR